MSQFQSPVRRTGGELDVFTGLLLAGAILMATNNMDHSRVGNDPGSPFKLVE
jgi:hypothetical protein